MKKTNFDLYLEEQLKDPDFAERFERAGEAWDVALQLAALREQAGLSQRDLARKLNTSQQQISRLESPGYEGHSLSMLRRVAKVLHARVRVVLEADAAGRRPRALPRQTHRRQTGMTRPGKRTADDADDTDGKKKSAPSALSAVNSPAPVCSLKSAICHPAKRAAALGHAPHNTPSPEGAKDGGELPKGWRWVILGDVAESMKNGIYKPASSYADDGLACLRMYNIGDGKIAWRDIKRMRLSEAEIREYELLPGDLLVNRVNSRELVGKSVAIPTGLERCVFESKNIRVRIRRDLASPEFVSYRLLSAGSRYFTQNAQQVVGMASISQPQVARFPLPLPPLPEQRRIVAEIEKQFTRLEAGVAALRRMQANLKRYRAAVLKAACEGKLVPTEAELHRKQKSKTAKFETGAEFLARILTERRQNWQGRGKYKEPAAPDTANLPPLPQGWVYATVEQLGIVGEQAVLTGPFGTNLGREDFTESGVPLLTISCLQDTGIKLEKSEFVSPEKATELNRYRLQPGDLLFSRMASVGRAGIVGESLRGALFNYHIMRLRLEPTVLLAKFYMAYVRGSTQVENYLREVNHGATRAGINTEQLLNMPVALPPLAEQTRIVAEVERRLSVVEELETAVSANLQRATRLRQSILQKAFTGDLV